MAIIPDEISRCRRNEAGATSIEYGLIAALVCVVIVGSVTILGSNTKALFDATSASVATAAGNDDAPGPAPNEAPGAGDGN